MPLSTVFSTCTRPARGEFASRLVRRRDLSSRQLRVIRSSPGFSSSPREIVLGKFDSRPLRVTEAVAQSCHSHTDDDDGRVTESDTFVYRRCINPTGLWRYSDVLSRRRRDAKLLLSNTIQLDPVPDGHTERPPRIKKLGVRVPSSALSGSGDLPGLIHRPSLSRPSGERVLRRSRHGVRADAPTPGATRL
jgi:hypothetical protein